MSQTYFKVPLSLSVKPKGEAELLPPDILTGLDFNFIQVKENGEEAIVTLAATDPTLQQVEETPECVKLTLAQAQNLKDQYQSPRIKQKYRPATVNPAEPEQENQPFETDQQGNRIIDTYQTVRSGFYLIDTPIVNNPD